MGGVREQLNLGLLRYSEDLEGVVLAYSDERVTSSAARLHPYFPFLAVTVTARVTLFCPRPGQRLVGRVIKVGADYVGLLVLGVFNAAIGAERIRREFKCSAESGSWVSLKDSTHRIKVGSYVRFTVDSVLDQASLFSIAGSLQEPGTGEEAHCGGAKAGGKQQQQGPLANGKLEAWQQQQQQQQQQDGKKKKDKHKDKDKSKRKSSGGEGGGVGGGGDGSGGKAKEKAKDKRKDKKRRSSDAAGTPANAKRQKS